MSVQELQEVFTYFAAGRTFLGTRQAVDAAYALGFAITTAEKNALESVISTVYADRLEFASFVTIIGSLLATRIENPNAAADKMARAVAAACRLFPSESPGADISRLLTRFGDSLSQEQAAALESHWATNRRASGDAKDVISLFPRAAVSSVLSRYSACVPQSGADAVTTSSDAISRSTGAF